MKNYLKPPTEESTIKAIVDLLNKVGFKAWRQANAGRFDHKYALNEILKLKKIDQSAIEKIFAMAWRKVPASVKGVPDIIGYEKKTGKWIGVEIKIGADKISMEQTLFHDELKRAGGVIIIANSFDDFYKKYCRIYDKASAI